MLLTERQAFNAMVTFLENYYYATKWDGIGALLGGLAITSDGGTADPAVWNDWLKAIEEGKDKTTYLELNTEKNR